MKSTGVSANVKLRKTELAEHYHSREQHAVTTQCLSESSPSGRESWWHDVKEFEGNRKTGRISSVQHYGNIDRKSIN